MVKSSLNHKNMDKDSKIFVAGGTGLVGSAIIAKLLHHGFTNITASKFQKKPEKNFEEKTRFLKLDLTNQKEVQDFFEREKPEYLFLAAAKVGGIYANNKYRADFIYSNLQIQNNIIHQSFLSKVRKLIFLGSSCIYPRNCLQPMKEEYLLSSELEYTNEPYAMAKIAGIKMCESYNLQHNTNFISVMPTNLYGYNDNFDLENSHVLPAMIRKMHLGKLYVKENYQALQLDLKLGKKEDIEKELNKYSIGKNQITFWGTGNPYREFLFSEDLADACVFIMKNINFSHLIKDKKDIRNTHINIGSGRDLQIKELASLIKTIIGYPGKIIWDSTKPDGTPKKLLDVTKLNLMGWEPKTSLKEGIQRAYRNYMENL